MRRININLPGGKKSVVFLFVVLALVCVLSARVNSDNRYDLTWNTIDGGGGTSSGGSFVLTGTIAQHDAAYSEGGPYEILGGFWPGGPVCFVDFEHFARFAEYWLEPDCNELNNWCDGADLNHQDGVDFVDLREFTDKWLWYCPFGWQLK